MLFSSPIFFLFFSFYFIAHWFIPKKYRLYLIVLGSTFFYGYWLPVYSVIPYLLFFIGWSGAIFISKEIKNSARLCKTILVITLLTIPLIFFKYFNFIYSDIFNFMVNDTNSFFNLALPIGISFITFTMIAYIAEIYSGKSQVESNGWVLLGYVLYFPQLIAGPILRPKELIGQIKNPLNARSGFFLFGFVMFSIGLIKKLLFADQIGSEIDLVWNAPIEATSIEVLGAFYGFSVQIYMDFSGYTDMAIGIAAILGVKLPINFNSPYCAESITDFWRKWHITLSTWLRDLIYIPLGGNRKGKYKQLFNVIITMLIGGLWHGAGWNFILWGLLHGMVIGFTNLTALSKKLIKIPKFIKIFLTFHIVSFLWVFFRADSFSASMVFIRKLVDVSFISNQTTSTNPNIYIWILIAIPLILHYWDRQIYIEKIIRIISPFILVPTLLFWTIFSLFISHGQSAAFIYFDF